MLANAPEFNLQATSKIIDLPDSGKPGQDTSSATVLWRNDGSADGRALPLTPLPPAPCVILNGLSRLEEFWLRESLEFDYDADFRPILDPRDEASVRSPLSIQPISHPVPRSTAASFLLWHVRKLVHDGSLDHAVAELQVVGGEVRAPTAPQPPYPYHPGRRQPPEAAKFLPTVKICLSIV